MFHSLTDTTPRHAAHQFDEYVWINETSAVRPVTEATARGLPAAHPFAPTAPVTRAASHTGAPHTGSREATTR